MEKIKRIFSIILALSLFNSQTIYSIAPVGEINRDFLKAEFEEEIKPFHSYLRDNNQILFHNICGNYGPAVIEMTDALASHPEYLPAKKLNLLYASSQWQKLHNNGTWDISSLLVAFELIERNKINSAWLRFPYLDSKDTLDEFIDYLDSRGIKNIRKAWKMSGVENTKGSIYTFEIEYKDKTITLSFGLGEAYIDSIQDDVNCLMYKGGQDSFPARGFPSLCKEFISRSQHPVCIFSDVFHPHCVNLVSDWSYHAKNRFSNIENSRGIIFGLNGTHDIETLEKVWQTFSDDDRGIVWANVPGEWLDTCVKRQALHIINQREKALSPKTVEKLRNFFMEDKASVFESAVDLGMKIILKEVKAGQYSKLVPEDVSLTEDFSQIHPMMDSLVSVHMAARDLRNHNIDLSRNIHSRVSDVTQLCSNSSVPVAVRISYIAVLLNIKREPVPEILLDLCRGLSEEYFKEFMIRLSELDISDEYKQSLFDAAMDKLNNTFPLDEHVIRYYGQLCLGAVPNKKAQEEFLTHPAARTRVHEDILREMYRYIIDHKSILEKGKWEEKIGLLDILSNIARCAVIVDLEKTVLYMGYTPLLSRILKGIAHDEKILEIAFLPIMMAIDNLKRKDAIEINDAAAISINKIIPRRYHLKKISAIDAWMERRRYRRESAHISLLSSILKKAGESTENYWVKRVYRAMNAYPRKMFLPTYTWQYWANLDTPINIFKYGYLNDPYVVFKIARKLNIRKGDSILVMASNSAGWQEAVLSNLVGKKGTVITLHSDKHHADITRANLERQGIKNVEVWESTDEILGNIMSNRNVFNAIICDMAIPMRMLDDFYATIKPLLKQVGRVILTEYDMTVKSGRMICIEKRGDSVEISGVIEEKVRIIDVSQPFDSAIIEKHLFLRSIATSS